MGPHINHYTPSLVHECTFYGTLYLLFEITQSYKFVL